MLFLISGLSTNLCAICEKLKVAPDKELWSVIEIRNNNAKKVVFFLLLKVNLRRRIRKKNRIEKISLFSIFIFLLVWVNKFGSTTTTTKVKYEK